MTFCHRRSQGQSSIHRLTSRIAQRTLVTIGICPRDGMGENVVYDYTQGKKTLTHSLTISTIHYLSSILNKK